MPHLLDGLRVLDLTEPWWRLAGRIFSDLGADVVLRRGAPGEPFDDAGRQVVDDVSPFLAGADVVLAHAEADPRAAQAVWVRITPYGSAGPRAGWRGSDLTIAAAGGGLYPTGDPDRPPVRCSQGTVHAHTCPEAVVGALTALASGVPQVVDVSAQETQLITQMTGPARFPLEKNRGRRRGTTTGRTRETWACKDGYVSFGLRGGKARARNLQTFTRLAEADGVATPAVSGRDWLTYDPAKCSEDELRAIEAVVQAYFDRHTITELYATAVSTGLMLAPCNDAKALLASGQLAARGFYATDGSGWPARPFRVEGAEVGLRSPAPQQEWAPRPVYAPPPAAGPRAWSGLKVVELGSGAAGPIAARYFADHGATVVRVESRTRPDFLRSYSPSTPDHSAFFAGLNAGKLDLSLHLKDPDAVALLRRLIVEWADCVVENFAPGATAKWGVSYADLKDERPDLVVASGCLWGNTGPEKDYPGFGGQGAALSGYTHLTGWPDRAPVGPAGTITDSLAPRFVAAGLAAALLRRRRTGAGCWLDLSQVEAAAYTLGPWLAREAATHDAPGRVGNADPDAVLHGVYPCADVDGVRDRWVAVAVWSEAERARLAAVIGADDADTVDDGTLTAWTQARSPDDVAEALQGAGLDAYPVRDWGDLHADAQLVARRHFVMHEHAAIGPMPYEENGFRLSAVPGGVAGPGPLLGEHTEHVLVDLFGMERSEYDTLLAHGALE
ncbi:MAG TPA: CoA transferase [Mycobacteriales bacterium]|nr:CoA transferase [Mycobacteriales bacterium]